MQSMFTPSSCGKTPVMRLRMRSMTCRIATEPVSMRVRRPMPFMRTPSWFRRLHALFHERVDGPRIDELASRLAAFGDLEVPFRHLNRLDVQPVRERRVTKIGEMATSAAALRAETMVAARERALLDVHRQYEMHNETPLGCAFFAAERRDQRGERLCPGRGRDRLSRRSGGRARPPATQTYVASVQLWEKSDVHSGICAVSRLQYRGERYVIEDALARRQISPLSRVMDRDVARQSGAGTAEFSGTVRFSDRA
ncbi:hypothetical protein OKW30_000325 [Paraburkholderia sp. Clong3]|nr:hypothetical protein [Paraburkholderia sp. CI2]